MTTLNDEQRAALRAVQNGRNLFLTGAGGTGKSHTIRAVLAWTRSAGIRCAVTALTGCAALLLGQGAKTLHSWAGIGLARESPADLAEAVKRNRRAARRWIDTQLLIIDEISMMTPELLEKLDLVARRIRKRPDRPFGGLQVVFAGDFCQLPPVTKAARPEDVKFVFECEAWRAIIQETVELVQILRQRDPVFQQLLNEARMGALSIESIARLEERMGLPWQDNEIRPTLLFTRNAEVDRINREQLAVLEGERRRFDVQTVVMDKTPTTGVRRLASPDDPDVAIALEKLDTDAPYDPALTLVEGAQVMLIVNLDQERGLVNGSRGVITGFTPGGLPMVRFLATGTASVIVDRQNWWLNDYEGIGRSQIPLRVAYAITIHKCVSEDTLLSIPSLGLIPIKRLVANDVPQGAIIESKGLQAAGLYEDKAIIEIFKGHTEKGITIKTTFGYELTGSMRHPILTYNKDTHALEWRKLPEIAAGDYVVLKKGAKVAGSYQSLNHITFENPPYVNTITLPSYIDEDFGYLIGVLLGDGSMNANTYRVDIISMDMDILTHCVSIVQRLFGITIGIHPVPLRKTPTWRIFFHSKQFIELFAAIGYSFVHAPDKKIPEIILRSPITVQKAVVRGLYDTDGGVSSSTINFTTTSYTMGKQLQEILLNLNIACSRSMMRDEIVEANWKRVYRLNISGSDASAFTREVGFRCERKQHAATARFLQHSSDRKAGKSQAFAIPNSAELIKRLRDELRGDAQRLANTQITTEGHRLLSSLIHKQTLRFSNLSMVVSSIPTLTDTETGRFIHFMYQNGLLIDTVTEKTTRDNVQMYDIGVAPENSSGYLPDGHDFVAGGFVNHNSQGSTLDSALVDIGSSTFEYGQAYVALSRVQTMFGLYVWKLDPRKIRAHPSVVAFYERLAESRTATSPPTDPAIVGIAVADDGDPAPAS